MWLKQKECGSCQTEIKALQVTMAKGDLSFREELTLHEIASLSEYWLKMCNELPYLFGTSQ